MSVAGSNSLKLSRIKLEKIMYRGRSRAVCSKLAGAKLLAYFSLTPSGNKAPPRN